MRCARAFGDLGNCDRGNETDGSLHSDGHGARVSTQGKSLENLSSAILLEFASLRLVDSHGGGRK